MNLLKASSFHLQDQKPEIFYMWYVTWSIFCWVHRPGEFMVKDQSQ